MNRNKYALYERAAQEPATTLDFLEHAYRQRFRKAPLRFREDFCGTFALAATFVARGPGRSAVAIDSDRRVLTAGRKLRQAEGQKLDAIRLIEGDVLATPLAPADVACALNFSYCVFHERAALKRYLSRCRKAFRQGGVLMLDCLPGIETQGGLETEFDLGDFRYGWEQAAFDPITRRALYYMHFTLPDGTIKRRAFRYDWRLWTVPELRDLLAEVGFDDVEVFWSGGDRDDASGSASVALLAYARAC
jgi:SAM-dependent methyltransferase